MKRLRLAFLTLLVSMCSLVSANPSDEELGFVDSIAALTFSAAWPTAMFKSWEYKALNPVYGGRDLLVRLTGESTFGGELWIDISFQFRNGEFSDIVVYQHNAILAPPFETSKTIGAFAIELASEYSGAQAEPRPTITNNEFDVAAVCVRNELGQDVVFEYRWGENEWGRVDLKSNRHQYFWWNYDSGSKSSPNFQIKIDIDFTSVDLYQEYTLSRYATTTPVNCDKAYEYALRFERPRIVGVYDLSDY